MARRRKSKRDQELDRVIDKINKTKPPSRRMERGLTARVKTHDITVHQFDDGVAERSNKKPANWAERLKANIKAKNARDLTYVQNVEAQKLKPVRREIPMPQELTAIMAPPLPPLDSKGRPNIVVLVYAFRAFQQFSHAHTRRNLGDPYTREERYQFMKKRFHEAMEDANLADLYNWDDF